jgi:hypothetical protein
MSLSFNVTLSDYRVLRYVSRPCFAAVNGATSGLDNTKIANIEYIPFLQNAWDEEARRNIEKVVMPSEINWEMCHRWWDYLSSLPYFSSMIFDPNVNPVGYQHGIKVNADFPADRVMLCLFLLRAPQFQTGIVRTWIHLIDKFQADPDVAFVTAFALNNKPHATTNVNSSEDPSDAIQRMYPYSDQESTIIFPQYFSLKGAKLLLNRLLCDTPDEVLYHGQQNYLSHTKKYNRYTMRCKKALGRFFAKKPGCGYSTGNIQTVIWNDIIHPSLRDVDSESSRVRLVSKHHQLSSIPHVYYKLNDDQIRQLLNLMAA